MVIGGINESVVLTVGETLGSCGLVARHCNFQGRSGWFNNAHANSDDDLDSADPSSTLIRGDAPPLLSCFGGRAALCTDGGEQERRDQQDAKEVEESHSRVKHQEEEARVLRGDLAFEWGLL